MVILVVISWKKDSKVLRLQLENEGLYILQSINLKIYQFNVRVDFSIQKRKLKTMDCDKQALILRNALLSANYGTRDFNEDHFTNLLYDLGFRNIKITDSRVIMK